MAMAAPPRRFEIEPLETTVKLSKNRNQQGHGEDHEPARTSAPEPADSISASLKIKPELIETSARSSRQRFNQDWDEQTSPTTEKRQRPKLVVTGSDGSFQVRSALKRPSRKFVPQLIETAQRSRRAGNIGQVLLHTGKTGLTSEATSTRRARILGIPSTPPTNTLATDLPQNPLLLEIVSGIQHNICPLARRRSYFSSSEHSFRVPDLDPIESSESEASNPNSPTTSSWTTDHSFMYKEATRRRESVDDRSSGYLLQLAANEAEKHLQEQALAAFVNSDTHEHVDHFIDSEDTERSGSLLEQMDCEQRPLSMEENSKIDATYKRQEHEQAAGGKATPDIYGHKRTERVKSSFEYPGDPASLLDAGTSNDLGLQKDSEMQRMRKEARPPMLGQEIRFPRCDSPEPSRFDPTQGCDAVKTAMCYLSEQSKVASEKGESLWCGQGNGRQTSTTPSLWSTANSRASSTHGLWGGSCVNGGEKSPRGPTGILTPCHDRAHPLSPCPTPAMSLLPPTPPTSNYPTDPMATDFSGIDEKLALEQSITEDFDDDFVTQVYNYLSLGYPSMARPFDAELSKISKISVCELRQDDHLAEKRGYIRLGKDGNLKNSEITEETCMRWRALRIYIQEWARQHPNMSEEELGMGGSAVRKGSWAL